MIFHLFSRCKDTDFFRDYRKKSTEIYFLHLGFLRRGWFSHINIPQFDIPDVMLAGILQVVHFFPLWVVHLFPL